MRFRLASAVYGILLRDDRVLLVRRAGSGYHDGELDLSAGHLDGGEDAVSGPLRELNEELTISADPDSCLLTLVMHRAPESPEDHEYLDLFCTVARWFGTPSIGEPDKCTELVRAENDQLPSDVIDYVRTALHAVATGEPLAFYGWAVA